jgi:hypothetical protein
VARTLLLLSVEMLKIERIPRPDCTAIKLTGRLDAKFLPGPAPQIPADGRAVVLDREEVTVVDGDPVRFLIDCELRGHLASRLFGIYPRMDNPRTREF